MFVDSSTTRLNGKAYPRHLLRETYREDGKVKHRTIANLSHCKPEEVEAIRLRSSTRGTWPGMVAAAGEGGLELVQGPSVGAVWLLAQLARELGIVAALGSDRQGKLALWQVIARVLDQGSRLSAVRLAGGHAVGRGARHDRVRRRRSLRQSGLVGGQSGGHRERGCLLRERRRRRRTCFSTT